MTQLFIDGIEVVLPQTFTVQVKRENPLITKNGEYTYDITLSLANPVNADLYRHLNRLNSVQPPRTKRKAVLVADNRVYCNGTEVITGWTDKEVTIQLASGNSELNYVIGGDKLISSLEKMPVSDFSTSPITYISKLYPDVDFCLAPVYDESYGALANAWGAKFGESLLQESSFKEGKTCAQPYLCAYIRAVLNALGYRLVVNQLEDTVYKLLYIVQVNASTRWRDMLPEWTVVEFLQQVEYMFDGVFVVDNRNRDIRFVFRNSFFAGMKSIHVSNVEDIYEADVEENPDIEDMADADVAYRLDDTEYWRFRCLSQEIRQTLPVQTVPDSAMTPRGWFNQTVNQRSDTVFRFADGMQYLFQGLYSTPAGGKRPLFRIVDDFAPLVKGSSVKVELDIGPSSFKVVPFPTYPSEHGGTIKSTNLMLPVIVSSQNSSTPPTTDLNDIIGNNMSSNKPSRSRLPLAFFAGCNHLLGRYNGAEIHYPLPFIDKYTYNSDTINGEVVVLPLIISDDAHTLKLDRLDMQFYQGGYDIDFRHGVKLTSHDANVYNPRNIFEIRNKRYICAEIEYTLDAQGRKGGWTGTFYPIRISDTEADARWILADGKWRDGGVWLDNGRWLDG